ncbi:MAG: hypothetical protein DMF56_21875 [Acidobacteria bacterium]|nr:MAG: hypothetical protein DMF56_21875 [Acidobacteriota bacterium]
MDKPFVLLAEDNEGTCTLIKALLQPEFQVEVAGDGAETIEKLKARQYAVILLDLLMPVTDGYAVLEFLKRDHPELLPRVIVMTASISRRAMEGVREYAVGGVITKPFEIEEVLATVREMTGIDPRPPRGSLLSSGMLLLLADFLRQRWM